MLGILGKKGDHYADQTMTSSHKNTELRSQETTGQEDRKGRKEGRKERRFEEEDEQVEVASSGQTEITSITDIGFMLVFKYPSRL